MLGVNDALFRQKSNVAPKPPARWVQVQEAYRNAGINLLKTVETSKSRNEADVYPALFLCRHAVELELKAALGLAYVADHAIDLERKRDEIFRTHDLVKLWKMFASCDRLKFIRLGQDGETFPVTPLLDSMQACMEELGNVDPSSIVFRYPVDKELASIDLSGISIPNFISVYVTMCDTLSVLRKALEHVIKIDSDPESDGEWSLDWMDRFENERIETDARLTNQAVLRQALFEAAHHELVLGPDGSPRADDIESLREIFDIE